LRFLCDFAFIKYIMLYLVVFFIRSVFFLFFFFISFFIAILCQDQDHVHFLFKNFTLSYIFTHWVIVWWTRITIWPTLKLHYILVEKFFSSFFNHLFLWWKYWIKREIFLPAAFWWQASNRIIKIIKEFLEQHTVTSICFEN
jgi:hypothetical protein